MADNNYGNRNAAVQISDDDPFAELTRIMGQTPQGEAAPVDSNDSTGEPSDPSNPFEMDMERELMGELEDAAEPAPSLEDAAEPASSFASETPGAFGTDTFSDETADAAPFELDGDDAPFAASSDAGLESDPVGDADDYWTEHQLETSGADGGAYAPDATAPYEPAAADDLLADMDLDFDDLDAEDQPVAEEPVAFEPEVSEVTASGDVSLEDELEMLLGAGADTAAQPGTDELHDEAVDEADSAEAPDEPAHSWRQSIFGRANYGPARDDHEAAAEADGAAWDEFDAADEGDTVAAVSASTQADTLDDPFEALAHMADIPAAQSPSESHHDFDDGDTETNAAAAPVEVDTVDVPEMALAQHDDLELPDLPVDDEPVADLAGSDLETEFSYDFPAPGMRSSVTPENIVLAGGQSAGASGGGDSEEDDFINAALGIGATAAATAGASLAYAGDRSDDNYDRDWRANSDGTAGAPYGQQAGPSDDARRRTGFMVAGAVLAVAILGGVGAFALSFGGGDDADVPVLVKADDAPLKVKPENPGGDPTVPNQDSVAYEAASGGAATDKPQQENLVSAVEEPVNMASRAVDSATLPGVDEEVVGDDPAASGKAEDRLDASASADSARIPASDIVSVQPRRVRTMIVRPDGTLVPREEAPVEETVAAAPATPTLPANEPEAAPVVGAAESQPLPLPGLADSTGTAPATTQAQPEPLVAPGTVQTTEQQADPVTPSSGPILPARPAEPAAAPRQEQVAQAAAVRPQPAAVPAPTATAGSEWSMQIASQPSSESAQATYQELARRYANILDGRGVNIVRADIPGKGTYYRVRVPSSSRNDGVALCERYKAAGGSCFVSK